MGKKRVLLHLTSVVACIAAAGASATPGTGTVGQPLARVAVQDTFKIDTSAASDVAIVKVAIAPGGETGWHSHPGPHLIAVAEGTLTVYAADDSACQPKAYPTGTGLFSRGTGDVRNERNEGAAPVVLYVTYVIPAGSVARADEPKNPGNCSSRGF
jgi:hypothetical protein